MVNHPSDFHYHYIKIVHHLAAFVLVAFLTTHFIWGFSILRSSAVLGTYTDLSVSQIIALTNLERTKHGLSPLNPQLQLNQAAYEKALDMAKTGNFDHYYQTETGSVTPWQFIVASGYNYFAAGENLARNYTDAATLMEAWMASPAHQANILNPNYLHIGVAVLETTSPPSLLVVQMLAAPAPDSVTFLDPSSQPHYSTTPLLAAYSPEAPAAAYPPNLLVFSIASLTVITGLFFTSLIVHLASRQQSRTSAPSGRLWHH